MTMHDPDDGPLARAAAELQEAKEATARADTLLEQVDQELRKALEVTGDE